MTAASAPYMRPVENLAVGDIILPPERELRLWMRRYARERGLSDEALRLTITEISEGSPDKNGRWLIIRSHQTDEWTAGQTNKRLFTFKARPHTPWPAFSAQTTPAPKRIRWRSN